MRFSSGIAVALVCCLFGGMSVRAQDAGAAARLYLYVDDGAHLGPHRLAAVEQAAAQALMAAGFEVQSVTPIARALFRPGMLVPTFDKPPPDGWPAALKRDWEQAQSECRARLRPADGGTLSPMASAQRAVDCQRTLAQDLFDRFVAHGAPAHVVGVGIAPAPGQDAAHFQVTVELTDPRTDASLRHSRVAQGARVLPGIIAQQLRSVLAGEGEKRTGRPPDAGVQPSR